MVYWHTAGTDATKSEMVYNACLIATDSATVFVPWLMGPVERQRVSDKVMLRIKVVP